MPKKAKTKKVERVKSAARKKSPLRRGKDALLERYGGIHIGENEGLRRQQIDWLIKNFVQVSQIFGAETVQRRLCELKGENFDEYDDPND